jgi:hypothetical protein
MKKLMSLVMVSLMLMSLLLVGCSDMEGSDEDLEASVEEMSDEELEAVVESTDETGTLAGQAVRMTDRTKLMASKELLNRYKSKATPILGEGVIKSLETSSIIKTTVNGKAVAIIQLDSSEITTDMLKEANSDLFKGGLAAEGKDWCCDYTCCPEEQDCHWC